MWEFFQLIVAGLKVKMGQRMPDFRHEVGAGNGLHCRPVAVMGRTAGQWHARSGLAVIPTPQVYTSEEMKALYRRARRERVEFHEWHDWL